MHLPVRPRRALAAAAAALAGALWLAAPALGHAVVSPPVAQSGTLQVFTLSVPTEREGQRTTSIELTVPKGFAIDSFAPASGWRRRVSSTGSGETAVVDRVTWTGGSVPAEEDAVFQFNATATDERTYTFAVRQTYGDGTVVDWNGDESSDTPAPVVQAKDSLGGGGTSVLTWIALILGVVAILIAIVGLVGRGGGGGGTRELA